MKYACTRLLWCLSMLLLAACGGGGGSAPQTPSTPAAQWEFVGPKQANEYFGLNACGAGVYVVLVQLVIGQPFASFDHGATWQNSLLAGATPEIGATGRYWRSGPPAWTTDCGVTWSPPIADPTPCLAPNLSIRQIWTDGDLPGKYYAVGAGSLPVTAIPVYSLCQSFDGGQSWAPGPAIPGSIVARRNQRWYAVTPLTNQAPDGDYFAHLIFSDDQGLSWQSTGLESSKNGLSLVAQTANNSMIYVIATTAPAGPQGQSLEGLWQSTDGGTSWSQVGQPFDTLSNSSSVQALAVNPKRLSQMYLAIDKSIVVSNDGGLTWSPTPSGFPRSLLAIELLFDPAQDDRLYAAGTGLWALNTHP
jgi:hypothetical protein